MREKVGTYADAGFPNYEDKNGDGYPDKVDVTRRLATFSNNYPDYYETFRPKLDGPFEPAVQNEKKEYVANEKYKRRARRGVPRRQHAALGGQRPSMPWTMWCCRPPAPAPRSSRAIWKRATSTACWSTPSPSPRRRRTERSRPSMRHFGLARGSGLHSASDAEMPHEAAVTVRE